MKNLLHATLCAAALCAGAARATEAPPITTAPAQSPADLDHAAVWAIYQEEPADPGLHKTNPREFFRFQGGQMRKFWEAARAFAARYPNDPRRYEALVQASYTRPWFLTGFKPEFDAAPREKNLIVDQPALDAFRGHPVQIPRRGHRGA